MTSRRFDSADRPWWALAVPAVVRVAGSCTAMALVASCASTAPDASHAADRTSFDGRNAVLPSPSAAREQEAGSYAPFVHKPEFPGQVTPVEAQECRDEVVAAGQDPAADWVLVLSRTASDDDLTIALRDDATVRVGCRLSKQAVPRTVAAAIATDEAGIRQQCGSVAGYDFTGWTVVTSMAAASGVEAVLVSTNGYTAYCSLQPYGWDAGSDQVLTMPSLSDAEVGKRAQDEGYAFPGAGNFAGASLSLKTAHTPIEGQLWWGSGSLYGADGKLALDARRLELTFTALGEEVVIPVVRGRWAARVHLPGATGSLGGYRAVLKNRSGQVLATHVSSS